jgi:competence protein ComEC
MTAVKRLRLGDPIRSHALLIGGADASKPAQDGAHPDMDHLGGFKAFCKAFPPINFWDTANREEKEFDDGLSYGEEDWLFYKSLRDGNRESDPMRLVLYSGARGQFYNRDENGAGGGDGLYVLAPTPGLITSANASGDFNDTSYVVLYRSAGGHVLFAGDSHDATWEHILENHAAMSAMWIC